MKIQACFSLALLGAVTVQGAVVNVDRRTQSVTEVIRSLKRDPEGGFKHVGDDGIARSYAPDGTVIDAVRLTNEQLMEAAGHQQDPEDKKHLEEIWEGVNGFDVPEQQLLNPHKSLLPRMLKDEVLAKELQKREEETLAALGQSKNVIRDLSARNRCFNLTCRSYVFCLQTGCNDCVVYDELRGTNCR
ncbi:hypothetical protein AJ78_08381 [Emergomyces pasteurianus Ep9510]|uniref:Uncharacterized protein n=1 Tax=Emergomyces pasteurianus Ep9510 TaxID=1447872 RepID=A0A1J9Q313_9EURO|nr:hypothetical protein AJ78_08381 [Emergomyces pasteurianus Ep9510]